MAELSFFKTHGLVPTNFILINTGALGFGAVFGIKWCYGKWPANWLHRNIAFLEFSRIMLSLHLSGHDFTDNEAIVHVINIKQSCEDKALLFSMRALVLVCLLT